MLGTSRYAHVSNNRVRGLNHTAVEAKQIRDSGRMAGMQLQKHAMAVFDDGGIIPGDIVQHF